MSFVVLLGRILYAAIFLMAAPSHFTGTMVQYALQKGVLWPEIAVPLSGLLALLGGLSILLGYKTRYGAWLIVLFLIPVTFMMHNFWTYSDPSEMALQQIMFMKNLALLGSALMLTYFGSGPLSIKA